VVLFEANEFAKLKECLVLYEWAHMDMRTKLAIIQEDLAKFHKLNPIEYIAGRIKSPESIAQKLHNLRLDITAKNAREHLRDIAGVRIICTFARDIPILAGILREMPHMRVLHIKDYVSAPKPSGYRGYHVIMEVPVFCAKRTENVPLEVQIRTEAMNFWATLEHKARYKYGKHVPQNLIDDLVACANATAELDSRMFHIHEQINQL